MITLYQFDISPFCDKVRRILHYKNQPYDIEEITVQDTLLGKIKRINPTGKLPAINHDGRIVNDSTDIAAYIENIFPDPPLIPSDPKEKALVHFLEDWADESLYFYEMFLRLVVPHNAKKWIPILSKNENWILKSIAPFAVPMTFKKVTNAQGVGRKTIEQISKELTIHFQSLTDWLGDEEWLVGSHITLADIAVYCQLFCINGSKEGEELISQFRTITSWMKRVEEATMLKTEV